MKATAMNRNRILNLFQNEIRRSLEKVLYARGDSIGVAGEPITNILFPGTGLISVIVDLADGHQVEAGMVGREGVVGGIAVFGGRGHVNNSICLCDGVGWLMPVPEVVEVTNRHPRVRTALLHFEQFLLVQARQTAACNAAHAVGHRLARWLLQACHTTGEIDLDATQETIAGMLGIQRATLSICANQFKADGLIEYRRGKIRLLNVHGLEAKACECHAALQHQYNDLLGGLFDTAAE